MINIDSRTVFLGSNISVEKVRDVRNTLLQQSDWTQMPDNKLTAEQRAEWRTYRQALRDITEQDINNITWPNQPGQ